MYVIMKFLKLYCGKFEGFSQCIEDGIDVNWGVCILWISYFISYLIYKYWIWRKDDKDIEILN